MISTSTIYSGSAHWLYELVSAVLAVYYGSNCLQQTVHQKAEMGLQMEFLGPFNGDEMHSICASKKWTLTFSIGVDISTSLVSRCGNGTTEISGVPRGVVWGVQTRPKFRRYRWSPRSHEQEEPASRFPFIVHCVLIRF